MPKFPERLAPSKDRLQDSVLADYDFMYEQPIRSMSLSRKVIPAVPEVNASQSKRLKTQKEHPNVGVGLLYFQAEPRKIGV